MGSPLSPPLGMGTMFDHFHVVGKQPVEMDFLNSSVTRTVILAAVAFSILPEIWS